MTHQKNCMGQVVAIDIDKEDGNPETANLGINIFETTRGDDSEREMLLSQIKRQGPLYRREPCPI